ncbi:hypothetical protein [Undibacterium sp. Di24W]|uniref:hypothetical protein n=1 Tax=Undibacterium sp. Di24W TaxID=3413033 RepID=UPI003BEF857E
MRHYFFGALLAFAIINPAHAQFFSLFGTTLDIVATPSTATIYKRKLQDNSLIPIGVGNAKIKLEKNDPNTIVVRQEGFRDSIRSFPSEADYPDKTFSIFLTKRVVQVTALPYDAKIYINGEFRASRSYEVEVDEGQTTTLEVLKPGYATVKRIYRWNRGGELPPIEDRIELIDRRVSVTTSAEGVELFSNEAKVGEGDLDFIVKRGTCAKLSARKNGWITETKEYCNKDGQPEPPLADKFTLKGRLVKVTAPEEARIYVNEKSVASGSFGVQVPFGSCTLVRVKQPGYLTFVQEYCAKPNETEPPYEENVVLRADGSYAASIASDQANVNFTIETGKKIKEETAWKLLSSIVLNYFDVLDNSDSQTGYLRTAWQIKTWGQNEVNESVVRTRVILKRIGDEPLRYSLKIVSEKNKDGLRGKWSIKDDEHFESWDRILNTYRDLIGEAQSRLK